MRSRLWTYLAGVAIVGAAAAAVTASITTTSSAFYACMTADGAVQSNTIRQSTAPVCKRGQLTVSWSSEGPQGPAGSQGPQGIQGPPGPQGSQGPPGTHFYTDSYGRIVGEDAGQGAVRILVNGAAATVDLVPIFETYPTQMDWFSRQDADSVIKNTFRYFVSNDCSGDPYFLATLNKPGTGGPFTVESKSGSEGYVHLIELGPSELITFQCYIDPMGTAHSDANPTLASINMHHAVAIHDLGSVYPAPLVYH